MRDLILQAVAYAALTAAILVVAVRLVKWATPGGDRPDPEPEPRYVGTHRRRGWSW